VEAGSSARLVSGLDGVTGIGVLPDGQVIAALTRDHRLARVRVAVPPR
jgi:hypothetical protein